MREIHSRSRALVGGAALVVVLSGCSVFGGDDEPDAAPSGAPGAADPAGAGVLLQAVATVQDAAGQESVDLSGELPVVGTRPIQSGDLELEVELNGVAVRGELMTVVFTVRNVSDSLYYPNTDFDDAARRPVEGADASNDTSGDSTDGVYVLDAAEGTRHLAAYDSEGLCVCSVGLSSRGPDEGGAVVLSTTFSAPPESTELVDVVIPLAGAFTGVPIAR